MRVLLSITLSCAVQLLNIRLVDSVGDHVRDIVATPGGSLQSSDADGGVPRSFLQDDSSYEPSLQIQDPSTIWPEVRKASEKVGTHLSLPPPGEEGYGEKKNVLEIMKESLKTAKAENAASEDGGETVEAGRRVREPFLRRGLEGMSEVDDELRGEEEQEAKKNEAFNELKGTMTGAESKEKLEKFLRDHGNKVRQEWRTAFVLCLQR
uniref:RxLR effector protein n=1 Tax=Chromera velia CCMP2878 TaxID=1169474 RepID=A0A0G4HHG2_9ALVE|eukprot:Cvel_6810.t1-p1 / transcript=Cvel_6810.t1 / gene=Cvel_6810 / organism=Chromera_velia_CCMP2878 / gene_product=hypothetical protein / transcript_product=hypothetical protein / location=Cvel_scaffold343:25385-33454(-) / protein_length=207 / sequence_SO=supercontig / SO=protein_coding / is_pseudo=false